MIVFNKFAISIFASMMSALPINAIDGKWTGELSIQGFSLPLVINFNGDDSSTMDSPLQNVFDIPIKIDYVSADSVAWSCSKIGASYQGRIAGDEISGIFSQRSFKFPLTLRPEEPLSVRRPQTPQPPFPYQTIDTVFQSADGTLLAGTVTIPENLKKKGCPMVVMVTGSGPQNRDEEFFEHKPFAVIADYLARNGIASFRYDDRGTAESQGSFQEALPKTFLNDAKAALDFARRFNNGGRAGILGHSEGGTLAMMLAEEGVTDFIVSLAGMSASGKETILDQNRHMLELRGYTEAQIQASMTLIERVFEKIIEQTKAGYNTLIDVDSIASTIGNNIPEAVINSVKANVQNMTPYFGELLLLDAGKNFGKIKCPVLAINGSLDTQVDASKNLQIIRVGIPHAKVYELEGLNHLLQHAKTGEGNEYVNIKETISSEVLEIILNFINTQIR